ncbi:hypothetical protein CSAL01_06277 [Colletotrichum salicis]|uniref:Transcription activator GCR1-like domain-containing protein n=1 Tax=Colletotrichum salicis TaxID=1209931 RepID=A0A135V6G6_9PEZI|nr:hypothetical protein CSAL01_06277 [Colletotrichum salicis]
MTHVQVRLVDYSDSEDEPEAEVCAEPSVAGPADEDGFAQIVIGLQNEYTKEVRELQERQEATNRNMAVYMGQVNTRLQKQLNVMTSIVKEVFGVDPLDPAIRDYALQDGGPEGKERGAALPSPSQTPTMPPERCEVSPPVPESIPLSSKVRTANSLNPTGVQERHLATTEPPPPAVRRSTGKRAPRPRAAAASRRPRQPPRRPERNNIAVAVSKDLQGEVLEVCPEEAPGARSSDVEQVTDLTIDGAVVRRKASRQHSLSPRDPVNPYDDPKYFSPLTVRGKDGVMRPIFKFYPHPPTVEEQWAEYKYGLHGQQPVELLEKMYRAKWRNGTYGRSWFTRRKAFWDKMKGLLNQGNTEEKALAVLRDLGSGSVPTAVAILCKERGEGTRPGRRKSRGQSVYSVCGSKHSRDESSSDEESSSSDSEDDENPRPIRSLDCPLLGGCSGLRDAPWTTLDEASEEDWTGGKQYSSDFARQASNKAMQEQRMPSNALLSKRGLHLGDFRPRPRRGDEKQASVLESAGPKFQNDTWTAPRAARERRDPRQPAGTLHGVSCRPCPRHDVEQATYWTSGWGAPVGGGVRERLRAGEGDIRKQADAGGRIGSWMPGENVRVPEAQDHASCLEVVRVVSPTYLGLRYVLRPSPRAAQVKVFFLLFPLYCVPLPLQISHSAQSGATPRLQRYFIQCVLADHQLYQVANDQDSLPFGHGLPIGSFADHVLSPNLAHAKPRVVTAKPPDSSMIAEERVRFRQRHSSDTTAVPVAIASVGWSYPLLETDLFHDGSHFEPRELHRPSRNPSEIHGIPILPTHASIRTPYDTYNKTHEPTKQ